MGARTRQRWSGDRRLSFLWSRGCRLPWRGSRGAHLEQLSYLRAVASDVRLAAHPDGRVDRHHFDAVVAAQDAADTYLPPFERCVREVRTTALLQEWGPSLKELLNLVQGKAAFIII